jgi:hypothetical protein
MFTVIIDDSISVFTANQQEGIYSLAKDLKNKKHTLEIIRRTEWHGGNTSFIGFNLDKSKKLYKPKIKERKIEFIGDSNICGYGNEGRNREEHQNFCNIQGNRYLVDFCRVFDKRIFGVRKVISLPDFLIK